MDTSHPAGPSINDGTELELCGLKYISMDEVVKLIMWQGHEPKLAKLHVNGDLQMLTALFQFIQQTDYY